jgi:hypothetical protein
MRQAAFHFVGLTLLSKSDAWQEVARKLEAQLPGADPALYSRTPDLKNHDIRPEKPLRALQSI